MHVFLFIGGLFVRQFYFTSLRSVGTNFIGVFIIIADLEFYAIQASLLSHKGFGVCGGTELRT
jgi:hypothetical protein